MGLPNMAVKRSFGISSKTLFGGGAADMDSIAKELHDYCGRGRDPLR